MKRLKKPFYGVMALGLAVGLGACASEPNDGDSAGGDDGDNGSAEGNGEAGDLVISMQSEITSFDPHDANDVPTNQVQDQIYETLIEFDEDMELQPVLAEDWQIEDNTITFQLQEGVTFHDGEEFNAEVVKKNIDRITDEEIASQRAFLFNDITEINVLGDYEIEFVTEEPLAPLIYSFAHSGGNMISPASIDEDYAAMEDGEQPTTYVNEHPVGTGYFKHESGTTDQEIVLAKNEDYWGEAAKLDTVTFKVVPDGNTRVAEVQSGTSHISEPTETQSAAQVEETEGMHLEVTDSLSTNYIGFNTQKEPFDDPDVRRAISMAVDNESVVELLLNGYGIPATGPMAPDVIGYDPDVDGIPYDPEGAKELLAEAGFEEGELEFTISTNDTQTRQDLAEYVQGQLQEIGVTANIELVEWGAYLEQTGEGNHDMFVLGWGSATGDADYSLDPIFHSDNFGDPGNRFFYENEEVDQLLDEAAAEMDHDARMDLYSEAQEIITEDAPAIFVDYKQDLNAVHDSVVDFKRHPTGTLMLHEAYIEE
ncbi:glutathione ABC transporter substrate-binding protein [Shouchella shacheensis]|uniref:glutathione ABC transporter substrate-binding protein n=1 Tax=Shouchella shacheensis TaxID=1649580 RepID=UPI00073FA9FE|nr:glutathione ABC transporter substrate-binding protein [Shouchella shacheensis]